MSRHVSFPRMRRARGPLRSVSTRRGLVLLLVGATSLAGLGAEAFAQSTSAPVEIAARVNGESITRQQVDAGVPADAFSRRAAVIRRNRLERLVDQALVRQFLQSQKIAVSAKAVDVGVAALRKLPPAQQCPCCRFATLDEYLKVESMTLPELREQVRNDLGLERYLFGLWEKAYPTRQARLSRAAAESSRIREEYARAWQIFFNTLQVPDGEKDPTVLLARARANSAKAWDRLQRGEPFDQVAREVSEDRMSRGLGGKLGFFRKQVYGGEFAAQLEKMKPGELSEPFRTVFGYHIVRREALTVADEVSICKREFMDGKRAELMERLRKQATIERRP